MVLFFDGTNNNKHNVKAAAEDNINADLKDKKGQPPASYKNDLSNVARMFDSSSGTDAYTNGRVYDNYFPIYIEGIGTASTGESASLQKGDDALRGGGFGEGPTGIIGKVRRGVDASLAYLRTMSGKPFEFIHLDVFGFSRGGAAARNAVAQILSGWSVGEGIYWPSVRSELVRDGETIDEFKFRFAGLYDTVASFGLAHWNDKIELNLGAVSAADRIVQLAAAEEHRKNFRLTRVGNDTKSFELFLPGVHSDIGGGYKSGVSETRVLWRDKAMRIGSQSSTVDRFQREWNWLSEQGWFGDKANPIWVHKEDGTIHTHFEIRGTKSTVGNQYCFIPLNMMVGYAKEEGLLFGNVSPVPPALSPVDAYLRGYAGKCASGTSGASSADDFFHKLDPLLVWLRRNYLHFSAYYSDLEAERDVANNALDFVGAMAPDFSGERRTRSYL
ncbi:phospholipase effector Tle1 domain-containing protein [Tsuneonella dongtanensis]|uniref:phospholipase effector Tle1 domain-containing protein n=1 Tax=Tsuneonella dongtanensis TaxID=692370 RepID=UPI0018DD3847|nr:DUF2235 domain-containing protein [Tsuneonella dongtanensis]